MDVLDFINRNGQRVVPNPNYNPKSKKNTEPATIIVPDVQPVTDDAVELAKRDALNQFSVDSNITDKYRKFGLNYNPKENLDNQLANVQSNWSKAFNAAIQTVGSEVVLGTIKAFSDIGDYAYNLVTNDENNDYTNPLSKMIGDWQKSIKEDIAPIYVNDKIDISNGGLTDFGWWASNFPSIASSITLFIPGRAVSLGLTKGFNFINKLGKLEKGANNTLTRKLVRKLSNVDEVSDYSELKGWQKALNNTANIERVNEFAKNATTAYIMRVAENYQEASQTYIDSKENAINKLSEMSDEEFEDWKRNHKDFIEENKLRNSNREEVASKIANLSANRTFNIDKWNFLFDIAQVYGLRNTGKLTKKVNSKSILSDNRKAIKSIGKSSEEIANMTKEASKFKRFSSSTGELLKGSGIVVASELSEGVEEMINYIAQQEGMTYGKTILGDINPSTFNDRLMSYFSNPELWESAFWGTLGGVVFQTAGSKYNQYVRKNKINKEKEKNKENEKTKEKINSSKWYELDEKSDIAAARETIHMQTSRLEDTAGKLSQIENENINIFSSIDPTTGKHKQFEGSARNIESQKQRAKASVMDSFISDSVVESVHRGTFDRFIDFISSNEMKEYMTELNQTTKEEADSYIEGLVTRAKEVKKLYEDQLSHMNNQAAFSNSKNKNKESNVIPTEYIVLAAKENLDTVLRTKNIDNQINILREEISTMKASSALEGVLKEDVDYESIFTLKTLTADYARLEQQKKDIKNLEDIDELDRYIKLDEINKKQEVILNSIENKNTLNGKASNSLGRVLFTLKLANNYIIDKKGNIVPDINAVEKTDKELLEEAGYGKLSDDDLDTASKLSKKYIDDLGRVKELYEETKKVINEDDKHLKELKETSIELYDRLSNIGSLEVAKYLNESSRIINNTDFNNYIDIVHNRLNKARQEAIKQATDKIIDIYTDSENNKDIVSSIIAAYIDGRQNTAKKIADNKLTNGAAELIDCLDILNFDSDNNITLARLLNNILKGVDLIDNITNTKGKTDDELDNEDVETEEAKAEIEAKETEETKKEEVKKEEDKTKPKSRKQLSKKERRKRKYKKPKNKKEETEEVINPEKTIETEIKPDETLEDGKTLKDGKTLEDKEEIKEDEEKIPLHIEEFTKELNIKLKEKLNKFFDDNLNAESVIDDSDNIISELTSTYLDPLKADGTINDNQYNELLKVLSTNAKSGMTSVINTIALNKKRNKNLKESAANVAYMSKIGISENTELPDIFIKGIEQFINNYVNASLMPKKDGKTVLDIKEITYVIKNSIQDNDVNIVDYLLKKLNTYLSLPSVKNSYYIVNSKYLNNSISFVNDTKDDNSIKEEERKLRVNIIDHIDFYNSENATEEESDRYFNILESLNAGDDLDVVVEENNIYFKKDDIVIGTAAKASYINGIFTQANKGFVEDVTLDDNGVPVSDMMQEYIRIFTDDNVIYEDIRSIILDAINNGITEGLAKSLIDTTYFKNLLEFDNSKLVNEGNNIEDNKVKMLEHLVKLYNYSTQNITFEDKESHKEAIVNNLYNYFSTLYSNYDTLNRINKDISFKISFITDGEVITKFDNSEVRNHHSELPFASDAIADRSKTRLSFVDVTHGGVVHISGHANEENRGLYNNQSVLTIFDRNDKPTFVTLDYLDDRDIKDNSYFRDMLVHVKQSIITKLENALYGKEGNSRLDDFNSIGDMLASLCACNNRKDYISLLRPKAGSSAAVYVTKTDNYNYDAVNFEIKNRDNAIIASAYFVRNPRNNSIRLKLKTNSPKLEEYKKSNKYFSDRGIPIENKEDIATAINGLMNTIVAHCNTEISRTAIDLDNSPAIEINKGFIQKRNGKIITNFDSEKVYDSYNDFIIDNNLVRVNLGKNNKGKNRTARGKHQKLNQVLYVNASVPVSSPVEEYDNKTYTPEIPKDATSDTHNLSVFNVFTKGVVSGRDLFISTYGQETYDDFVNQAQGFDILEVILPRFIKYHPRLNYIKTYKNGTSGRVGPEAATNTGAKDSFIHVAHATDPNKISTARIKSGYTIVGDTLINMLSSKDGRLRKRGIAILVHERLHELIATNPNYTKTQIFDSLRPIYNEFTSFVDNLENTEENKNIYTKAKYIREKLDKAYGKRNYATDERLLEEFLVETITNSELIEVMNNIKSENVADDKKDNLFSKFIRFMAKWLLGVDVNKDSLLEKEIKVLNNLIDDKNKERTDILKEQTVVKENKKEKEETKKETVVKPKILTKVIVSTPVSKNKTTNNFMDDTDFSNIGISINDYDLSINGHLSALPLSEKAKFRAMRDNGAISYVCKY